METEGELQMLLWCWWMAGPQTRLRRRLGSLGSLASTYSSSPSRALMKMRSTTWLRPTLLTRLSVVTEMHQCCIKTIPVWNTVCSSSHRLCVEQMASSPCLWRAGLLWGRPYSHWWRGCVTQTAWCAAKRASTPMILLLWLMAPVVWEPATSEPFYSLWPTSRVSLRFLTQTPGSELCSTLTSRGWSLPLASTTTRPSSWTPSNASTTGAAGPARVLPSPTLQSSFSANPNPTSAKSWLSLQMGALMMMSEHLR